MLDRTGDGMCRTEDFACNIGCRTGAAGEFASRIGAQKYATGALTPSTGIHKACARSSLMSEPLNWRPRPHYRYLRGTCPL
ncbi:hypothetical protein VPJ68_05215, partial [Parabacteroides distasonis]